MKFAARLAMGSAAAVIAGTTIVTTVGTSERDRAVARGGADADLACSRLTEAELSHGPDSLETATALVKLSERLRFLSPARHAEEGIQYARRALAIRESAYDADHQEVAAALELLAMWHWDTGDYEAERPLVERALTIRERANPRIEMFIARDLHMLSDIYRIEGDYGQALVLRERAGPYIERSHGPVSDEMALHYHYLAAIQAAIGELDSALVSGRQAVDIRERVLPPTDPDLARSLDLVGRLLIEAGDLPEAEPLLKRALAIWEGSEDPADAALALAHLGSLFAARQDWRSAVEYFTRVLQIRSAVFGPDHPLVARSLSDLGAVQRRRGELAAARSSLARALDVQKGSRRASYPDWAATLREQSLLDGLEGRFHTAFDRALETERLTRDYFRASSLGLSEREALAQARTRGGGLDLAWAWATRMASRGDLADDEAAELLDESIRSRALVLDTLASRRRILALHQDNETGARVAELARVQGRLTHLLMAATGWQSDWERAGVMSQAQADADRAERSLAALSRDFRHERERGEPGLSEIQRSLPERTALVSYFRSNPADDAPALGGLAAYAACVILPGRSMPRIVPLGAARGIDRAVGLWRDAVSIDPRPNGAVAGEAAYRLAARRLADKIWDPVEAHLQGADRVFVVPDGALQHVSFATLIAPGNAYLVEAGYAFHYLTAERDLVAPSGPAAGESSLLALGDPAYGDPASPHQRWFDPLPGSRKEASDIAATWSVRGTTQLLTGEDATEAAFKQLAPSFRVLHIATHGFFQAGANAGLSPLRVAGLAMAGANRPAASDEDGMLTAEEISLLDLRGVDWAVLSACATGGGVLEPGEGVLGLRRAFQIAGARSLVLSLWPVDDDATRYWMRSLYASRRASASTVAAVRDAMRGALEEQRRAGATTHPYFWGSFVSVGDWR